MKLVKIIFIVSVIVIFTIICANNPKCVKGHYKKEVYFNANTHFMDTMNVFVCDSLISK